MQFITFLNCICLIGYKENSHLESSHPSNSPLVNSLRKMSAWKILTHVFKYSHPGFLNFLSQLFTEVKAIVKILIVAYLQKCKQLLRFGLLYKIKVIEDTFRHREEFSNIFSSKVLSVIIVQVEFSPVNCPLSPPSQVNSSCQMPSDEFFWFTF